MEDMELVFAEEEYHNGKLERVSVTLTSSQA